MPTSKKNRTYVQPNHFFNEYPQFLHKYLFPMLCCWNTKPLSTWCFNSPAFYTTTLKIYCAIMPQFTSKSIYFELLSSHVLTHSLTAHGETRRQECGDGFPCGRQGPAGLSHYPCLQGPVSAKTIMRNWEPELGMEPKDSIADILTPRPWFPLFNDR